MQLCRGIVADAQMEASCSSRVQAVAHRCVRQPVLAAAAAGAGRCTSIIASSPRLAIVRAAGARSKFMQRQQRGRLVVTNTYPEPETEKERSTLDFPQEWITPQPSRRPDIFPEFEKLETPLPKPLPGDPELPEDEEEEEKEKREQPDPDADPEEQPDKEAPPPEE